MNRAILISWLTLALVACRGSTLDIGPGDVEGGASPVGQGSDPANGSGVDAAGCPSFARTSPAGSGDLASLAGTWTGYIENYQFRSGSDMVVLSFSAQDGGSASGTIVFGQGSPSPPPPTDPTVPYYPDPSNTGAIPGTIIEGYHYTMVAPTLDGSRLRFSAVTREPYRAWCELQTSYPWFATPPNCTFGCLPQWPGKANTSPSDTITLTSPDGGSRMTVSAGYFSLCADPSSDACDCDPTSCTVRFDRPGLPFDMQLTAGHLDGSVVIGGGSSNVHFTSP